MKRWLTDKVRDGAQHLGYEVHRSNLYTCEDWRQERFLEHHRIDTVLDVGANRGQYGMKLFNAGYKGRIISFEALPDVYDELKMNAQAYGDRWTVAPRCALSDEEGKVQFYVTSEDASSSMYKPTEASNDMQAIYSVTKTIEVDSRRLENLADEIGVNSNNILLKLDVHGSEGRILKGASEFMPHVKGVMVEVALLPVYDGQPLANEIDDILVGQGYSVWDILPVFRDGETGRLLYYDAVYFRD